MTAPVKPGTRASGGEIIARELVGHGVLYLFTLCGGHIAPILVACRKEGIRVIDVRHEATAVFAADAMARLTGNPGVVAVTAGPGVTNTLTALKNAQLAQSPVVLMGGATATLLKGRGSLQDIEQLAPLRTAVKWAGRVKKVGHIAADIEKAFRISQEDVPGPVFLELPVDLLYGEEVVRDWYLSSASQGSGGGIKSYLTTRYLQNHMKRLFDGKAKTPVLERYTIPTAVRHDAKVLKAAKLLEKAQRPLLLIGSQAVLAMEGLNNLIKAVDTLNIPVYLSGMARGLLGVNHPLQLRHHRKLALREADLVILAGVPCDFRLNYGRQINRKAILLSINRRAADLKKNRRPQLAVHSDAGLFVADLAYHLAGGTPDRSHWMDSLRARDNAREQEILELSKQPVEYINPLKLCREIDAALHDNSMVIVDGGDFAGTASYIVRPRQPLNWLDPGVFGTLGVGAGFALGAKLCQPDAEVWLLYGDGAVGYSLAEFDTFVRHQIPVIGIIGNDGGWSQIARDQVAILGDDTGTTLDRAAYHDAAEALGAYGLQVETEKELAFVLQDAKATARLGQPVLVNALIGKTGFRKGSISL